MVFKKIGVNHQGKQILRCPYDRMLMLNMLKVRDKGLDRGGGGRVIKQRHAHIYQRPFIYK